MSKSNQVCLLYPDGKFEFKDVNGRDYKIAVAVDEVKFNEHPDWTQQFKSELYTHCGLFTAAPGDYLERKSIEVWTVDGVKPQHYVHTPKLYYFTPIKMKEIIITDAMLVLHSSRDIKDMIRTMAYPHFAEIMPNPELIEIQDSYRSAMDMSTKYYVCAHGRMEFYGTDNAVN